MAKKKQAPKQKRQRRQRAKGKPRQIRKDARGVPLTSNRPPFAILPSDFSAAMRPPADAPTKATARMVPAKPTTATPERNAIELTPFAYQVVIEAIRAAHQVQVKKLNPKGGPNLRYRIEIAAAFLAHVMIHYYDATSATGLDEEEFVNLGPNIAIHRAQEIYGQNGAWVGDATVVRGFFGFAKPRGREGSMKTARTLCLQNRDCPIRCEEFSGSLAETWGYMGVR